MRYRYMPLEPGRTADQIIEKADFDMRQRIVRGMASAEAMHHLRKDRKREELWNTVFFSMGACALMTLITWLVGSRAGQRLLNGIFGF